jgi:hypothetical protein
MRTSYIWDDLISSLIFVLLPEGFPFFDELVLGELTVDEIRFTDLIELPVINPFRLALIHPYLLINKEILHRGRFKGKQQNRLPLID